VKTQQTTFPYYFFYWQVVFYAFVGLLTSLHLTYTHYKNFTDLSFSSFCAISQAVNCDTVAQSPWSVLWGLPLALWGVYAYALFLVLLIPLRQRDDENVSAWSVFSFLALLASCFSIYLAVLSATRIHSWCVLCIISYAVNFLLAFASWITFRRFSTSQFFSALPSAFNVLTHTASIKWAVPLLLALVIVTRFFIPTYWVQEMATANAKVANGITTDGNPWIGAETPLIVIEECTDYQCFQCRKIHTFLRQLINQHPNRLRLVHRHFPLDNEFNRIIAPSPFHVGSGRLALVGIVAANHGSFWAVNDALYLAAQAKEESIQIDAFAEIMQISADQLVAEMYSEKTLKHLQHDIVQGLQHGITGTPSFVVGGKVYQNTIPPDLLKEIIK
jgi:uncharacterized membrane protein/protein-disulfide isomerase